jgi:hypothetical protein
MEATSTQGAQSKTTASSLLAGLALLICVCVLAAAADWARARVNAARATWPAEVDMLYLPSPVALRLASMGHHEMVADLLAARTNIYFGDQISLKGEQRWLSWYVNSILDLDPYFEPLYLRGAVMLVYSTRDMSINNLLDANKILERGIVIFPTSWELYFQLGFHLAYEMPPLVAANDPRKPLWRKAGTEALRKAAIFDNVPSWLPVLVAGMMTESGERELAIKHLERVYASTADEQTRLEIQGQLNKLVGAQYALGFEENAKKFKKMVASRFPYAPEAFSVVSGRRFTPFASLEDVLTDPANRIETPTQLHLK